VSELHIEVSIEEVVGDIKQVSTAKVTMEENRSIMTVEEEKGFPRLQGYIEEMMDGLHARDDRLLNNVADERTTRHEEIVGGMHK